MATSITRLPVETIGDVLRRLDSFSTLAVCIRSSPVFWRAFQENSQVCRDILKFRIGLTLLPYAIAIYEARHRRNLNVYTEDETHSLLDALYTDPASISRRLARIDTDGLKEIDRLHNVVQRSAHELAERALSVIESGSEGIEVGRIASTSELHRLCQALYRVELYMQLFGANGKPECQLSFELQKSWFFDRHPPWMNEQLACVHDFLEWKLSHSLHHLTFDGKDFDDSFLDRRPRGVENHWMQCYMSRGLLFIDDLEHADAYRTKIQLLLNAIGSGTARFAESLKSLSKDSGQTVVQEYLLSELICPIDAAAISVRWMHPYIPVPEQTSKTYSSATMGFLNRVLKSYAEVAVRSRGNPPFVHKAQVGHLANLRSLATPTMDMCLQTVSMADGISPGGNCAQLVADVLIREMGALSERHGRNEDNEGAILEDAHSSLDRLASFQAYLLYVMVLVFYIDPGGVQTRPFLRHAVVAALQQMASASACDGLVCAAELRRKPERSSWAASVVAEAKRRTLFTLYLVESALAAQDGLPTFMGTELRGLPAPTAGALWTATTLDQWEAAYGAYADDWLVDGQGPLRIKELWTPPSDLDAAGVACRHRRVDRWLQSVDSFGTMMYAVTSHTHGPLFRSNAMAEEGEPGLEERPPASSTEEQPYSIFDKRQRAIIVLFASVAATFSGFASNIYFPALPTIATDMDVSVELINLTVTAYLVFQGLAPSLWGPVSDAKGRRVAYAGTFLVFIGACVGLALALSYAALVVLRCLQSTGSASTIAIGAGVVGDITTRANRGGLMSIFQAGLLAPVAVGPVIGGALAGSLGWRAIFWFLVIYAAVFLILLLLCLPETLRALVANGNHTPTTPFSRYPLVFYQQTTTTKYDLQTTDVHALQSKRAHIDVTGPLRILCSKQAALLIFFVAVYYTVWQMSITAMSTLFSEHYGLGTTQIGLTFIANGVGCIAGTLITGRLLNIDYQRVKIKHDLRQPTMSSDFPLEEARLRLVPVMALLQCAAVLLFGWTVHFPHRVSIAVPIVATFLTGWTAVSTQSVVMTYLVDVFHDRGAAAGASLNLARCLLAAGGTSFVMPLIRAIGVGPALSLCTGVQAVALLALAVQWRRGPTWRREAEAKQEAKRNRC
ncbi:major facilitator superfamily transporter multidrug resistance [Grosmannia clavigera kw1407]|uniref:Major facilitator superfamily transporter multidrug resistance n=1 Tax=Grosmannia clavigera (strain kw1407 / UAMH 11150) TaxID=655863 RepID=F0XKP3_GROCL|nr:major facilitator superfamily transporter multidrug resistance [Grosmannia clavigera kw1407]EFX01728.1 major facilitator superfamily transporter multidrug resistance [Grosmannia clavigera kw1407]